MMVVHQENLYSLHFSQISFNAMKSLQESCSDRTEETGFPEKVRLRSTVTQLNMHNSRVRWRSF